MKTEEIKTTKIELDGQESDHFKSALKKVQKETERAGFNKEFSAEEAKVIKDLNTKLNPE